MSKCKFPWLVLFLSALIFVSGCTEQGGNTTPTPTGTSIRFKDIQAFLQKPSQVQFSFRVSDNLNHAIVVNPASLPTPFRIFEDNQEIDYTETSYFVHPATSLELDMVILLDLTNSMATWSERDTNGISLEVDWANDLIDQMSATHRMAIMEHHDRNVDARLIAPFSSDKNLLHTELQQFLTQPIDHGSSRIWDAFYSAIEVFDGNPLDTPRHLTN